MKWDELTPEQKAKAIDWDINPECIAEDAYDSAKDYREALKAGHDAVFVTYESLVDWWDGLDDETQQEILSEPDGETTGA